MKPISVQELTDFLNQRTNGFSCSICRRDDWSVQSTDGVVGSVDLANHAISNATIDAMFDHNSLPPESYEDQTMADNTIAIRCNHCGHLEFFDLRFVEELIHG